MDSAVPPGLEVSPCTQPRTVVLGYFQVALRGWNLKGQFSRRFLGRQGRQGVLNGRGSTGGNGVTPDLMELRQYIVGLG